MQILQDFRERPYCSWSENTCLNSSGSSAMTRSSVTWPTTFWSLCRTWTSSSVTWKTSTRTSSRPPSTVTRTLSQIGWFSTTSHTGRATIPLSLVSYNRKTSTRISSRYPSTVTRTLSQTGWFSTTSHTDRATIPLSLVRYYQDLITPSFHCDEDSVSDRMVHHYFSHRPSYHSIVSGTLG